MSFVHLHVRSGFSLADSVVRVDALAARAKALGMPAVAVADPARLHGAVRLEQACRAQGIRAIHGVELRLRDPVRRDRCHGLVLLARDRRGFGNLVALVSRAWQEHPREASPPVAWEALAARAGGMIALWRGFSDDGPDAGTRTDDAARTDDAPGAVVTPLNDLASAREALAALSGLLGPNHLYLELCRGGLEGEEAINDALVALSRDTGLSLVATAPVRFLEPSDAPARAVLAAMQDRSRITDDDRLALSRQALHMASADEMAARFADHPEALASTLRIASRIEADVLPSASPLHFPAFPVPDGQTVEDHLAREARAGLDRRMERLRARGEAPGDPAAYLDRLDHELGLVTGLGFANYFLTVAEYVNWARERGIPVGPGRGSGAGSLLAWALGITDVDPVRFGLVFERFLNPERVSPPDFDIDFCMERRDEVERHVVERHGRDRVAGIATYAFLHGSTLVRKAGAALGVPSGRIDRVACLARSFHPVRLEQLRAADPRLDHILASAPDLAEAWDIATRLDGIPWSIARHAVGIVVSDRPVADRIPLCLDAERQPLTQWDMREIDRTGLVKFDLLGLQALTILRSCEQDLQEGGQSGFRIEDIPLHDDATFRLLSAGDIAGLFQLDARGMADLLQRLRPDRFEDLPAVHALFRPGPLGARLDEAYVASKEGRRQPAWPVPGLEPFLRDTRGVMLFQEQLMRIAIVLAGSTPGGADLLRRAMGRKDASALKVQRRVFVQGAVARGMDRRSAGRLFDWLARMAEHLFNQSHAVAYGLIAWRMAWLKANHREVFERARGDGASIR